MSLEEINIIDAIGIKEETGQVELILTDAFGWDDVDNHLLLLQEKLNNYLAFLEGGEIYKVYTEAEGRKIDIVIYAKYEIPQEGLEFLHTASEIINEAGFGLRFVIDG